MNDHLIVPCKNLNQKPLALSPSLVQIGTGYWPVKIEKILLRCCLASLASLSRSFWHRLL